VGFLLLLLACVLPAHPALAESPLSLVIENQTDLYNRELNKEVDARVQAEGFTLIGNLNKTFFRYEIKKGLRVEAGILWNFEFGEDNVPDEVDPVISLHYAFAPYWLLTAGTIRCTTRFSTTTCVTLNPLNRGFKSRPIPNISGKTCG